MHSDHRRRHHLRPASAVYPGDRVTLDAAAIAALRADADADLPAEVVEDAALIVGRRRPRPDRFRFATPGGPLRLSADADVVVVRERSDALLDL